MTKIEIDATEEQIEVVKNIVDRITIDRKSHNMAVINIYNKITGERREMTCNTRMLKIVNMNIFMRPMLNWNGK